jgi:serine protease AprX
MAVDRIHVATWRRVVLCFVALAGALTAGVGVRAQHRAQLSTDLLFHESRRATERTRVIVKGTRDEVTALARRHGVSVVRWLGDGAVLRATGGQLTHLAADRALAHLSGDPEVRPSMSVAIKSILADQTWAGAGGLLGIGGIAGVTGAGIGVAVIDSGITPHAALKNKIVASVSMLADDPSPADEYGHGTHVAGIIAGARTATTSLYPSGVAPGVQLINIRVLGDDGSGFTSDVIAGIDWAIENRTRYNIRVINLSLGHPVMEPAATDPLCEAVRRAVAAGIVVVAAAGNAGENEAGVPILGGVTSPGNSPYAITVGAIDTKGTNSRSDDSIAPYSSRGPTKFDFTVKPDIAAPGARVVSLEAAGSYLPSTYPLLHRAGVGNNAYMHLSGTSMAAPIVTAAAALLLQGTPGMTTAHVKMALQAGAGPIEDAGLMGAGAGSLNIWASRQIAAKGLSSLLSSVTGLLGLGDAGGAFFWDAGTLAHRVWDRSGLRLLGLLDLSRLWANPAGVRFGDLNLAGLLNPLASMPGNRVLWGEVATWAANDDDSIIWGTDDSIIWGTNDEIVWGTAIRDPEGDSIIWGTSGDDSIIWGTQVLTTP